MSRESPEYYRTGNLRIGNRSLDCLDIIRALELPYELGAVLKYVWRYNRKPSDNPLEDLEKAQVFLNRFLDYKRAGSHAGGQVTDDV